MDRFRNTRQPDWDWWGRLWPAPGETLRALGLASGDAVTEVGGGNGHFALPAARVVDPAPVYAVDLDGSLLDELEHLAAQQELDAVTAVHGDARELSDLLPGPVDVCLVANTLHGVDDVDGVAREVRGSLREGGRFVVNWHARPREGTTVAGEPRGPPTELRLSPAETERAVAGAAAFARVRTVELPPYHYGIAFER